MVRAFAPQGVFTHCLRGHEWSEENTYHHPSGDRICRACRRERAALTRRVADEAAERAVRAAARAKPRTSAAKKAAAQSAPVTWTATAACRDADPELFFPTPENTVTAREARVICKKCPVREECLAEALRVKADAHGVWAGLTRDERRSLRRKASRS